jgi:carbon monoxide dehydrogenase subunit G
MAVGALRSDGPGSVRRAERRIYVNAPPRLVWAALHDPANAAALFPELTLGPAEPSWPAAATVRHGRSRLGLLRTTTVLESLEARPESRFRVRIAGDGFESVWIWRLEPLAGGTRVVHAGTFAVEGPLVALLVRFGRRSLGGRLEDHLAALKEHAETASKAPA